MRETTPSPLPPHPTVVPPLPLEGVRSRGRGGVLPLVGPLRAPYGRREGEGTDLGMFNTPHPPAPPSGVKNIQLVGGVYVYVCGHTGTGFTKI